MITAMEMHDSTVAAITWDGPNATVTFDSAYIHKCSSDAASTSGTGWAQVAILELDKCAVSGNLPKLPCDLNGGSVVTNGKSIRDVFVLPFAMSGDVQLNLVFINGETVVMTGTNLTLHVIGEPEFIEDVPFNVYAQLK